MNDSERDELLIRLDERLETVLKRLENGDKCMKDHESRIVKVEGFQNTLIALAGSVAFVISIVGSWVFSHFKT